MALSLQYPLSEVLNVYFKFAIPPLVGVEEAKTHECQLQAFVANLQCEKYSDDRIYDELIACNPTFGCPLGFYQDFYTPFGDFIEDIAKESQKKADKEVRDASTRAQAELSNKQKCAELEWQTRSTQTEMSTTTTSYVSPIAKHSCRTDDIGVGCYVDVQEDLSVGKKSYGGIGYVVATSGHGENCTFSVKYIESYGKTTEKNIPYSRLTDLGNPFNFLLTARPYTTAATENKTQSSVVHDDTPKRLHEILSMGYSKKYSRGWRARQFGFDPVTQKRSESFHMQLCQDARELVGYLSASPKTHLHNDREKTGRFKVRKMNFNPKSLRYLAKAWGVSKKTLYNHLQCTTNPNPKPNKLSPTQMSIIDNFESAKIHFTGHKLYIQHRIQTHSAEYDAMQHDLFQEQSENIAQKARVIWSYEWREEAKGEWITLSTATCEFWECRA